MYLSKEQIDLLVNTVAEKVSNRFKQEFLGEVEELQTRTIRNYSGSISRRSWKTIQKWCVFKENGPITFPDHVRLYYRKGDTEVLIQEFPPQVRYMRLYGSLAKRNHQDDMIPNSLESEIFGYSLALPYMVFIYKFEEGYFKEVYLSFSNKPLKNLKEQPLVPYLSNVEHTLKICLGKDFGNIKSSCQRGELTQQVAFVLSHFWQSIYSNEWSSNYWESKIRFANDPRLATLAGWEQATMEDPLFVIDNVNWLPYREGNYGDIVATLFENDIIDTQFQEELSNDFLELFLEEIGNNIKDSSAKVINKIKSSDVSEILLTELRNLGIVS